MRNKFTFFIAMSLISLSLAGQTVRPGIHKNLRSPGSKNTVEVITGSETKAHSAYQKSFNNLQPGNLQSLRQKSYQTLKWLLDSATEETYDTTARQWFIDGIIKIASDAHGNMVADSVYARDTITSPLVLRWKDEFTFDANGREVKAIYYEIPADSNHFIATTREGYTYNANGLRLLDSTIVWNKITLQWAPDWKEENIYNASGLLTQTTDYAWDSIHWVINWKYEYTYNGSGIKVQRNEYYWENSTSQWNLSFMDKYVHDLNGNLTQDSSFYWQSFDSTWVRSSTESYTYFNNQMVQDLYLSVNWGDKYIYTYDTNGNIKQEMDYSLVNDTSWKAGNRVTYFWSEKNVTGISNRQNAGIRTYPNPASDIVVFDRGANSGLGRVELFDMHGRKVLSAELSVNNAISVSSLKPGIYLYKLSSNDQVLKGKISIK